ncbi:MAG: hypothetical protein RL701_3836 [Pseudomonadota bacterium]
MSMARTTIADSKTQGLTSDDASDAEQPLRARVGHTVGSTHRICRHLASGGMGHVFLAEHVHLGVYAAVKVARYGHDAARQSIAHEACMLSQLEHPNIVRVLDVGQLADGVPYLMMEYVSGLELDTWLDGCGAMAAKRALGVLKQLACSVDYLHAQGIVHGDIKPANIIIDGRAHDFVKLVDFGIATRDVAGVRRGVVGTPAYMAPEQARGELCGPAIDVYGVAALALELLTGRPPYDYKTAQDVLTAVLTEPPASPSSRGLNIPGLDEVFDRGLHQDPAQRFQHASDFVEALERVVRADELQRAVVAQAQAQAQVHPAHDNEVLPWPLRPTHEASRREARAPTLRARGFSSQSMAGSWWNRLAMRIMAGIYALT